MRRWLDPVSIQWKLPLAIGALWLVALAALGWTAHRQIVDVERAAATERLATISRQLADGIEADAARTLETVRVIAARPPLADFLRPRAGTDLPLPLTDPQTVDKVAAALADTGRRRERVAATELWDLAGRRLVTSGRDSAAIARLETRPLLAVLATGDSAVVGGFRRLGDSLVIPLAAPVRDGGRPIGYVVQWRHILGSPAQREEMRQLIGTGSALFVGVPGPDAVWTDLVSVTDAPSPGFPAAGTAGAIRYDRAGDGARLAVAQAIEGTPWLLAVELSEREILAPAARFRERVAAIGAAVLLAGLIGVWLLTRRITRRLGRLADAAESVGSSAETGTASGPALPGDELTRLGVAFDRMSARVTESHRALEANVAELRATQDRFAHTQRMEAVGRLAGGIAHDFNNLLTVILGGVELALMSDEPVDRETLLDIRAAGDRAAGLTAQLLAFSRRQLTAPTVLDMNDVTRELDRMLVRLIGENVRLATRPSTIAATVRADRGQIEQVLVNLAVNARDAMPDGGTILIEVGQTTLSEDYARTRTDAAPGDYVVVAVSDTGTGMTEAVKSHLFEPFFTTKEPGKGTGLGLATCYGIVRQSGGHISVYSEPGVGTTVRVYLPYVGTTAPDADRVTPHLPRGEETILLVEDEAGVRQVAARILAGRGYRVVEAADAETALTLLAATPAIELVVTDVVLPGIGGRVLAERAAELRPGIRVLFMSGYTDDVVLQHRLISRDIAFVQKPFTPESLGRGVREVLDRPA